MVPEHINAITPNTTTDKDAVLEMRRRGARYGLATMCIGVGQGIAAVFESAE